MMSFDAKALLGELDAAGLEALVETMVLAASADEDFSAEERSELAASIGKLAQGTAHEQALQGDALTTMLESAEAGLASDGREARIASVKERLPDAAACKAALGMAISVTAVDGIVRTSERELIMELAEGLGVDRNDAADLVAELTRR